MCCKCRAPCVGHDITHELVNNRLSVVRSEWFYYYYHVQWSRVASFNLSSCLQETYISCDIHSSMVNGFVNGSLDFTFYYYFLHLSGHKMRAVLCMLSFADNGARFIHFHCERTHTHTHSVFIESFIIIVCHCSRHPNDPHSHKFTLWKVLVFFFDRLNVSLE